MARTLVMVRKSGPLFHTPKYTNVSAFFERIMLARFSAPSPCERVLFPYERVLIPSFTMCNCPDGRECHNCK